MQPFLAKSAKPSIEITEIARCGGTRNRLQMAATFAAALAKWPSPPRQLFFWYSLARKSPRSRCHAFLFRNRHHRLFHWHWSIGAAALGSERRDRIRNGAQRRGRRVVARLSRRSFYRAFACVTFLCLTTSYGYEAKWRQSSNPGHHFSSRAL